MTVLVHCQTRDLSLIFSCVIKKDPIAFRSQIQDQFRRKSLTDNMHAVSNYHMMYSYFLYWTKNLFTSWMISLVFYIRVYISFLSHGNGWQNYDGYETNLFYLVLIFKIEFFWFSYQIDPYYCFVILKNLVSYMIKCNMYPRMYLNWN